MKRTPPQRKVPLKSKVPIRARSSLKQKTPIRQRSEKRAELYRTVRAPLVKELLEAHPACSARLKGCQRRSVDVHEVKSRGRGGSIVNRANLVTLCRSCHDYITTHPKEAAELGWLKHSWDDEDENDNGGSHALRRSQ